MSGSLEIRFRLVYNDSLPILKFFFRNERKIKMPPMPPHGQANTSPLATKNGEIIDSNGAMPVRYTYHFQIIVTRS